MRASMSTATVAGMSRVAGVSRMSAVRTVSGSISVTVMHEPAHCHNAEAYATDGETDEIKVHSGITLAPRTRATFFRLGATRRQWGGAGARRSGFCSALCCRSLPKSGPGPFPLTPEAPRARAGPLAS